MATSFFNDKNRNIAGDLYELMVEAKQEVPDFLKSAVKELNIDSRGMNRRYGGGGGGHRRLVNSFPFSVFDHPNDKLILFQSLSDMAQVVLALAITVNRSTIAAIATAMVQET